MAKANFIYFLRRGDGLVKIGFSTRVKGRIAELEKSHGPLEVLRVIHGDKRREDQIHNACRRHKEYGEWFRDSAELREIIAGLSVGKELLTEVSDDRKVWSDFEDGIAAKVMEQAKELVMIEYQANGNLTLEAIRSVSDRYKIPFSTLHHLFYGRTRKVSAPAAEMVRLALVDSRERKIKRLLNEIEVAKNESPDLDAELDLSGQIVAMRARLASIRAGLSAG